jgi:phosphoenolpyruvate carboxykinase (ATP)
MPIAATRTLVDEALSGRLDEAEFRVDDVFGFEVPVAVHGIEDTLLRPRDTWRDPEAYDRKARELAGMFRENFESKFADAGAAVAKAGPRL